MLVKLFRTTIVLALTLVAWNVAIHSWAEEQANPKPEAAAGNQAIIAAPVPLPMNAAPAAPGGFNYYVQPGQAGMVGAQLYVSPRPTPPVVGHTYVTYPPLDPHEFLYHHHRVYHTYNPGSGSTRTRVWWH